MDSESVDSSSLPSVKASDGPPPVSIQTSAATNSGLDNSPHNTPSRFSSWAKSLKLPQPGVTTKMNSQLGMLEIHLFHDLLVDLQRLSLKAPSADDVSDGNSTTQSGFIGTVTKGLVDSSRNTVKAVQV